MAATFIARRVTTHGRVETVYRLSRPLEDVSPPWRNVILREYPTGARTLSRAAAYERSDGSWAPVPNGSWIACYSPLSERDAAFALAEIAEARK